MPIIYHITTVPEWNNAKQSGEYISPSLANEGFIHCSEAGQVPATLSRFFKGKTGLVKLSVDTAKLKSPMYYEWSPSVADTFPHIYGPINLDAVNEVVTV
jgi:uncharacterized protein (DUF952 family)